ncbi:hypothetical protein SAMN05216386_2045 [Nitrosospira briensis]|uniref:DUF6484 domain-containing protein n=1 Tax=Nitrosospira briensis TaxID=35799 RepID=A0A1I5CKQ6_9PROT|nr:DUF6484 domain-containing protein [Nitrosospira briensis]SFN87568.1 hypothetical protein SAMN05216386_2045 [Nitrosospira briensis]
MGSRDVIEEEEMLTAMKEASIDCRRSPSETGSSKRLEAGLKKDAQAGVVIGELIGMTNEGLTPLILYPGQPGTGALAARTIVDLHGAYIGREVVLMFEGADPSRPIIMGVLQEGEELSPDQQPGQVEVDVDGERMLLTAKEQLVLRCGKASITLTKAGKVMIEGNYVLSRSSGVNRIKGGSIQLN